MSEPSLFPLPLTPFEHYLLVDDRRQYPMTFAIQFRLQGRIQRALVESALTDVLSRHPLLTARIERRFLRIPRWCAGPARNPLIDWGDLQSPITFADGEWIDLTRESGLRVWGRHDDDRALLTFQFHHCCCDGIGAFQFLGDLLAAYARLSGVETREREIHVEKLRHRGEPRVEATVETENETSPPVAPWTVLRAKLGEVWQALNQWPHPLSTPRPDGGSPAPYPEILTCAFDSRGLRKVAKASGVTINDLLLRDLLLAVRDWNRKFEAKSANPWLRITMPTNLRSDDRDLPAANVLGYAFITRRESDGDDPQQMLQSIAHDTAAIKRWQLGAYFNDTVAAVRRFPGAMSLFSSGRRCFATIVMSNLGDPTRRFVARLPRKDGMITAGDLVLNEIIGTPPLRPLTHATLAVLAHGRILNLCLRCDPHYFSDTAAHAFLDLFRERLEATALAAAPANTSMDAVPS